MINYNDLTPYDLGIVWGLGSYTDGRMVFRHREKYYIDRICLYLHNTDYAQTTDNGIQYVVKSWDFNIRDFYMHGWTPRNADCRDVPMLNDYLDFLRAYIELHSSLKYTLRYRQRKPKGNPYKALALIIYGNYTMLTSINRIMHDIAGVNIKSVQLLQNGKTASLNYASLQEIDTILNALYGEPNNNTFWDTAFYKLQNPIHEA